MEEKQKYHEWLLQLRIVHIHIIHKFDLRLHYIDTVNIRTHFIIIFHANHPNHSKKDLRVSTDILYHKTIFDY